MRASTTWILSAGAAAAVASLAWAAPEKSQHPGAVSSVIFGAQTIPLRFSHKKHLVAGATCDTCHEDATTSQSSLDNLIPTERACDQCHAIERDEPDKKVPAGKPPASCKTCHPGYAPGDRIVARVRIPIPNIKFNHKVHAEQKIACRVCHGDFVREGVHLATRAQLPRMSLCLTCHDGKKAPSACSTCHITESRGFIKTKYTTGTLQPSGSLRAAAHDMTFRKDHKAAARSDSNFCANCHRKQFCVDCHNGVMRPMDFHPSDYVTLHVVDARRNKPDCSACHRLQTFCVGCHSRSGVSADGRGSEFRGPSSGIAGRRFHPPGWVEYSNGLPSLGSRPLLHHSFQAQRNIKQCAACHREEFCKGCHTAEPGSLRVNPHPRNWANSRRCRALVKRNKRLCLRCHIEVNELSCSWVGAPGLRR